MPTITFDVKAKQIENGLVELLITRNDQYIRSTLFTSEVNTPLKLATWILSQKGKQETIDPTIQRRFTVAFHNETSGSDVISVIDNVSSSPLPQDDVLTNLPAASSVLSMSASDVRRVVSELVRYLNG